MKNQITVIIPTSNRIHCLKKVLPTYVQPEVKEIIVVDDGSQDGTSEWIQTLKLKVPIRVIRNDPKKGANPARNQAYDACQTPFAFQTDDDVLLEKNHFKKLLLIAKQKKADIVAGRRLYLKEKETMPQALKRCTHKAQLQDLIDYHTWVMDSESVTIPSEIEYPFVQSSMLISRKAFDQVRPDNALGGNSFRDETDFQASLVKAGFKIVRSSSATCFHLPRSETIGGGMYQHGKAWYEYWSIKNHWYFLGKHYAFLNAFFGIKRSYWQWAVDFLNYKAKKVINR